MAYTTISETPFTVSVDTDLSDLTSSEMTTGTGFTKIDAAVRLYARASDDRVILDSGVSQGIYTINESIGDYHRVGGQQSVFMGTGVGFASFNSSKNGYHAGIQSATTIKLYRFTFGVSNTEIGSNTGLSGLTSDYWCRFEILDAGGGDATINVDYSSDGSSWTNAISVTETSANLKTARKPATKFASSGPFGYITSWKAEEVTSSASIVPILDSYRRRAA